MNYDPTNHRNNNDRQDSVNLISRMINPNVVFLKYVFILKESDEYRLVITQENSKLLDCKYKTLQGAKAGCARFIYKTEPEIMFTPIWSYFYPVDEKWLQDKLDK